MTQNHKVLCFGPLQGIAHNASLCEPVGVLFYGSTPTLACTRKVFLPKLGHKVPCGLCEECDRRYINTWVFRLILESLDHPQDRSTFLTLTYDEDHLPGSTDEAKEQFQLFMKRLRRQFGYWVDDKRQLRYAASLERGDLNGRFHWHVILFGISYQREVKQWLEKTWSNGFIDWQPASVKTIRYVLKYVLKSRTAKRSRESSQLDTALTGCWLMSKRPGLGSSRLAAVSKILSSLTEKSVRKLHGSRSVILTPWKNKPVGALRFGNILYPLHRYLQERLRVPALDQSTIQWVDPSDVKPSDDILYTKSTSAISTVLSPTVNKDEKEK